MRNASRSETAGRAASNKKSNLWFPLAREPTDRCFKTLGTLETMEMKLVDEFFVPETFHFVLYVQFPPFQLHDLEVVCRRMRQSLVDFLLQRLVPSFEFRKVRFDRHMASLPR
jgi:hypothetical protein